MICFKCGKSFEKKSKLARHSSVHSNERPFKCLNCEKTFKRREHLKRHLKVHSGDKPFVCNVCNKGFSLNVNLKRHLSIHDAKHSCSLCDLSFTRVSLLNKHILDIHTPKKLYSCGDCDAVFDKWSLLVAHQKSHLQCSVCQRSFKRLDALREHLKTHELDRPKIDCTMCKASFYSKKNLMTHVKAVHGEKRFVCHECGAKFGYKHVLEKHRKVHLDLPRKKRKDATVERSSLEEFIGKDAPRTNDNRKFNCLVLGCDLKFNRQYDLNRHVKSAHPEIDTFYTPAAINR